ncbi:unnamed protein product [Echinostoma caproni]|uniref:Uncharacterized protein n=1 Tax=Echinostoma caproni TaxID=27848 RepID=A0A183AE63_9TREM|nr:unnamed protein product [Echinostoma caproni]
MDIQSLLKSLNVDQLEQWHILCIAATTFATLCVFTYICYRLLFPKRPHKSKKAKNAKKRNDEKKTATESPIVASCVKPVAAPIAPATRNSKTVQQKRQMPTPPPVSEPSIKSEVSNVKQVSRKVVPKIPEPEHKEDSSSDVDDGQWIEVGKNKKEIKNHPNDRSNKLSEAHPDDGKTDSVAPTNKRRENDKKTKSVSVAGKAKGDGTGRPAYKPIEEPNFSQPSKPNRRGGGRDDLDDDEEEWQEVRFSRRSHNGHLNWADAETRQMPDFSVNFLGFCWTFVSQFFERAPRTTFPRANWFAIRVVQLVG